METQNTDSFEVMDNDVRYYVYQHIAEHGHAPAAGKIAKDLDLTPGKATQSLKRLHEAHVLVLAPGSPNIWMAHPFSALPTDHVTEVGGKKFWGN